MQKKSVSAGRRPRRIELRQRGAALLIFLLIVVLGALTYLVTSLGTSDIEARRAQQSQEVLAKARDALIGYGLRYREDQRSQGQPDRMYGYLPLPDLGTTRNNNVGCTQEGCEAANFAGNGLYSTVVGRLPWRTLGIEPLRDSHGECLWYLVSGGHQNIQRATPMNWDTLGHLDIVVANGFTALTSILANAHDRPVAVIFSPGPPLPGQDRVPPSSPPPAGDDVAICGGNYNAVNYLDPFVATALVDVTNYLSDTNSARGTTGQFDTVADANPVKKLSTHGKVFESGGNFLPTGCQGANCNLLANDSGLELNGDSLFGAIRRHAYFRNDINSLLGIMSSCLGDEIAAGSGPVGYAKIAGADNNTCYGSGVAPIGYYPHYKDQVFVVRGPVNVNGANCPAALLFANQRRTGQQRHSAATRGNPFNYLEGINWTSFTSAGTEFSGQEQFERVSPTQTISQDIVRCVQPTFSTVQSPGLNAAGLSQLANYSFTTRILTLGQPAAAALPGTVSNFLYGCAWKTETRSLDGGVRSYFTFRINDAGWASWPTLGFTFTLADSDNNGTNACGAAAQHLGYSGNNTESPFIAPPKVAVEVDLRRETGFDPTLADHLLNGRNDPASPAYRGGHVAIDYWGGETSFSAMPFALAPAPRCTAPAFDPGFGANCYLPQEEDDNVHARVPLARAGFPAPPTNPPVPATELAVPPNAPMGAYKLDPALTGTPVNQDIHVRVELTRTTPPNIRVATVANLNIAAPGNPVNGVMLTADDRVWVRQQTVQAENGFYVWNGPGVAMTQVPAPAADSATDFRLPRVRVATTNAIDLSLPGDIIDGVFLFPGDRVLVKNQLTLAHNGVYVWNAPHLPVTRSDDADSAAELAGMVVEVQHGTQNARSIWRQNTTSLVVDTTPLSWTNIRVSETLPAAAGVPPGSIVQIQKGAQATAWYRSDGAIWSRQMVRVATQSNLNLAAPGDRIDGITMVAGDRVLVRNQSSAAQNGVYQWNGAAFAMTRTADANSAAALAGALTQVLEGSDTGRAFRQTTLPASGTIDAGPVQWAALDRSTSYLLEVWILLDSPSYPDKIATMKDTTRAMSLLYPGFTPHLQDRPVIPYSFRNARPGFTIGQRTSINDQTVLISNFFTTWLE